MEEEVLADLRNQKISIVAIELSENVTGAPYVNLNNFAADLNGFHQALTPSNIDSTDFDSIAQRIIKALADGPTAPPKDQTVLVRLNGIGDVYYQASKVS